MAQPTRRSQETRGSARDGRDGVVDQILDAAENVVIRDGIGKLTLDAAAREAKLSKGGLMHHFPSKDDLIDALVHRKVEAWRTECNAAIDQQAPGPGRVPRAILNHCLASTDKWTESLRRRGHVLVAALVHDSRHVEPLRKAHKEIAARVAADGLAPGIGETVQLAVDGLWFNWIFGLEELKPQRVAAVRAALRRLVEQSCCEQAATAVKKSARGEGAAAGNTLRNAARSRTRKTARRKGAIRA
jgi:AcrR family transcriptional regulator